MTLPPPPLLKIPKRVRDAWWVCAFLACVVATLLGIVWSMSALTLGPLSDLWFSAPIAIVFGVTAITLAAWAIGDEETEIACMSREPAVPHWEAVEVHLESGEPYGWKVRWSEPDSEGRYLWVGHYHAGDDDQSPSLAWCRVAAENHARRLEESKRIPWSFDVYREGRSRC